MNKDMKLTTIVSQKCLIITGTTISACLEKNVSGYESGGLLTYYCLYKKDATNIPMAKDYEVIVDFSNKEIHMVIVDLLNRLLNVACNITVKVLDSGRSGSHMNSTMELLRKLEKNNLIQLDILNEGNKVNEIPRSLEKVTFFVGPGNTGKTSILSSISELFALKKQRVALLDLTMEFKLKNYFSMCFKLTELHRLNFLRSTKQNNNIDLFTYDYTGTKSSIGFLSDAVQSLREAYDAVLVNTDTRLLSTGVMLFHLPESIYIVHDCMLNKTAITHDILFHLNQSGIDMTKISMIYNKVAKKAMDMGMIEEKLVFIRDSNNHLIPLIDIRCRTLEIFYSEKTMAALNKKILTKTGSFHIASRNYVANMDRLYRCIRSREDCEFTDMQFCEFIRYQGSVILQYYVLPRIYNKQVFVKIRDFLREVRDHRICRLKKVSKRIAGLITEFTFF